MNKIEQNAIETKNVKLCYILSLLKRGIDIDLLEQVVIDSKNVYYNYCYARDVNNAKIQEHSKVILESKNPEYNYFFAINIPEANYESHERVLNESGDLEYNFRLAILNDGINDISKEEKVILESKNPHYNYLFAKFINSADIKAHLEVLNETKTYGIRKQFIKTKIDKK